jgi:hypothetical protein
MTPWSWPGGVMRKIYEVMVVSDGEALMLDAIEHEGAYWLVPRAELLRK